MVGVIVFFGWLVALVDFHSYIGFSYLLENPVDPCTDILDWWQRNQSVYPNLFKMACDYLAIPVISVPSECIFSITGKLVTNH